MKILFRITLFAVLTLSACISQSPKHLTMSQRTDIFAVKNATDCDTVQFDKMFKSKQAQKTELDSGDFKMMTWNMHKGKDDGWKKDFKHLAEHRDILTIQEARITDDLRELLEEEHYNWDISIAFKYRDAEVGVLTASRLLPAFACTFRSNEPVINLPKTTMVTLYPLSDTNEFLMVVNIHSLNFPLGTEVYSRQLEKVEKILLQHNGPMIFSGDVNTWSNKRMAILKDLSIRLGLKAVTFNKNYRSQVFGHDIDHIYYRGLTVTDATVVKVDSSDHNPLLVSFRLEEEE